MQTKAYAPVFAAVVLAAGLVGGFVLAQQGVIATDDMLIEIRQAPGANVVTVTDIERTPHGTVPRGESRRYTEARP